jgi:hypothetical protein
MKRNKFTTLCKISGYAGSRTKFRTHEKLWDLVDLLVANLERERC